MCQYVIIHLEYQLAFDRRILTRIEFSGCTLFLWFIDSMFWPFLDSQISGYFSINKCLFLFIPLRLLEISFLLSIFTLPLYSESHVYIDADLSKCLIASTNQLGLFNGRWNYQKADNHIIIIRFLYVRNRNTAQLAYSSEISFNVRFYCLCCFDNVARSSLSEDTVTFSKFPDSVKQNHLFQMLRYREVKEFEDNRSKIPKMLANNFSRSTNCLFLSCDCP